MCIQNALKIPSMWFTGVKIGTDVVNNRKAGLNSVLREILVLYV